MEAAALAEAGDSAEVEAAVLADLGVAASVAVAPVEAGRFFTLESRRLRACKLPVQSLNEPAF